MINTPTIKKINEYKDGITFTQREDRQYYIEKQGEKVAIVLYGFPCYKKETILKTLSGDFGIDKKFVMTGYFPMKWGLKVVFYAKNSLKRTGHGHSRLHSAV